MKPADNNNFLYALRQRETGQITQNQFHEVYTRIQQRKMEILLNRVEQVRISKNRLEKQAKSHAPGQENLGPVNSRRRLPFS